MHMHIKSARFLSTSMVVGLPDCLISLLSLSPRWVRGKTTWSIEDQQQHKTSLSLFFKLDILFVLCTKKWVRICCISTLIIFLKH